jgi:hypothetical protein
MPTGLKAWIVYIVGAAVFVAVLHYILRTLIGLPPGVSLMVSLPVGIIGFVVFLLVNEDGHFGSMTREGRRQRRRDRDDFWS